MSESIDNRPTLADVARVAGVSLASVSRVLNNTGSVSSRMRARVAAAARELGYQVLADDPASPSGAFDIHTVPLVVTDVLNPYFYSIVQGAQEEAEACDLFPILVNATPDPVHQLEVVEKLCAQSEGGLILCAADFQPQEIVRLYEQYRVPLVVINTLTSHPNIPSIMIDFKTPVARATQHLLDLGHTEFAFLAGPVNTEPSRSRGEGIRSILQANGLSLRPEWCPVSRPTTEGGFQAMTSVLAASGVERPTAVIVYNDMMAIGVLHALRVHKVRCPEEVSVIGFDDIPFAAHTHPPLSTIAPPKYQMGKLAVQALCQLRSGSISKGGYTLLESTIIMRDSVGPVPIQQHPIEPPAAQASAVPGR